MIYCGFNLQVQQNIAALRPIRGEMFIAGGPFFDSSLRRSATAFTCIGNLPLPDFAPKGARSLGIGR